MIPAPWILPWNAKSHWSYFIQNKATKTKHSKHSTFLPGNIQKSECVPILSLDLWPPYILTWWPFLDMNTRIFMTSNMEKRIPKHYLEHRTFLAKYYWTCKDNLFLGCSFTSSFFGVIFSGVLLIVEHSHHLTCCNQTLDLIPELQSEILAFSRLSYAWGAGLLWLDHLPSICRLWNTSLICPRNAIRQGTWHHIFHNLTEGLSHHS